MYFSVVMRYSTGYGLDGRGIGDRVPVGPTGTHRASYPMGTGDIPAGARM
jgi:hypothetical protein